ncbi:MAG: 7-cyano-7-deazaguanine synthase QueC [Planctomycetota bacterium]
MEVAPRRAVVLLSGGMDSATAAAWARAQGFVLTALSFAYGQRHEAELEAARAVGAALGVDRHRVLEVDLASLGGSALVGDGEVPKDRPAAEIGEGIPATYVPARNTVFLALALAAAEAEGAQAIVLGVNALDYSGYPDCRPGFLAAFEEVARLGTRVGVEGHPVRILAPLLRWTKARIVVEGERLGVPWALTLSCYDPGSRPDGQARPCGRCDACLLRARGFAEAGIEDPGSGPW